MHPLFPPPPCAGWQVHVSDCLQGLSRCCPLPRSVPRHSHGPGLPLPLKLPLPREAKRPRSRSRADQLNCILAPPCRSRVHFFHDHSCGWRQSLLNPDVPCRAGVQVNFSGGGQCSEPGAMA